MVSLSYVRQPKGVRYFAAWAHFFLAVCSFGYSAKSI